MQSAWFLEWFSSMEIVSFFYIHRRLFQRFSVSTAILVFRLFRNSSKFAVKVVHTIFHSASIIFISLGLAVEFISHYYSGEPDLYSLHSWVGMATIVIFISQFIFGFVCFFFPSISARLKSSYLKIHIFFGVLCFVMAIATSLIGLNQNARFNMIYYELPPEGILINLIGLLMLFYGILVVYLVTKPSFQRKSEVVIE